MRQEITFPEDAGTDQEDEFDDAEELSPEQEAELIRQEEAANLKAKEAEIRANALEVERATAALKTALGDCGPQQQQHAPGAMVMSMAPTASQHLPQGASQPLVYLYPGSVTQTSIPSPQQGIPFNPSQPLAFPFDHRGPYAHMYGMQGIPPQPGATMTGFGLAASQGMEAVPSTPHANRTGPEYSPWAATSVQTPSSPSSAFVSISLLDSPPSSRTRGRGGRSSKSRQRQDPFQG